MRKRGDRIAVQRRAAGRPEGVSEQRAVRARVPSVSAVVHTNESRQGGPRSLRLCQIVITQAASLTMPSTCSPEPVCMTSVCIEGYDGLFRLFAHRSPVIENPPIIS